MLHERWFAKDAIGGNHWSDWIAASLGIDARMRKVTSTRHHEAQAGAALQQQVPGCVSLRQW
jgi:hypothetical protein